MDIHKYHAQLTILGMKCYKISIMQKVNKKTHKYICTTNIEYQLLCNR